ncbi:MAG TPA: histidinol dehydrogenase [Terriglobales bacterium]|jgi:histidinol dehydrogenase
MANTIRIIESSNPRALRALLERSATDLARAEKIAAPIVADVRRRGDAALAHWTRKLEGARADQRPAPYAFTAAEMAAAWRRSPAPLRQALRHAQRNLRTMAAWQMPKRWTRTIEPGVRVGQVVRPLKSAGCYVPGGRHPLPSTLLMTAVTARAAGVARVVVTCPRPDAAVLAAGHLAGIDEMYALGGAQAIAALAYGTTSIQPVDKIVGPGNVFVTAAKKLVWADCAIDFLAGPTEVLIVAGKDAHPAFVAADLVAQAEHDPQAAAWLATDSRRLAQAVVRALERQLAEAPNPIASASLRARGAILITRTLAEATALAERIAPEHITVPAAELARVTSAGSIFVGDWAPQAVGDYMSGTNHVLPTAAGARWRGGLSVLDFVKVITVQELTPRGLARLAPDIITLAQAEGLTGHAASIERRGPQRGLAARPAYAQAGQGTPSAPAQPARVAIRTRTRR